MDLDTELLQQSSESLNYEQDDLKFVSEKHINVSLNTYNILYIAKVIKEEDRSLEIQEHLSELNKCLAI